MEKPQAGAKAASKGAPAAQGAAKSAPKAKPTKKGETGIQKSQLREAMLCSNPKNLPEGKAVRCNLCAHHCLIPKGQAGLCLVRKNINGKVYSLNWGKAAGISIDPIEKKPFFHFKPGSKALSFGTPGCNFRCLNCQNWDLSQGVRNRGDSILQMLPTATPAQIAKLAKRQSADAIAYTYSEPTIFFEYAYDTISECRKLSLGIPHLFVSNGYFTKEAFELIQKENLLQAIRIDLKFMDEPHYKKICGANLKPVLNSIERVHNSKIHLELINLVIPQENDSDDDFEKLCQFVSSLSPDIPLHFSRFFPLYKMENKAQTPIKTLQNARKIAKDCGLNYVYIGNTNLQDAENTYCPECNLLLIKRNRFLIEKNVFEKSKKPNCPNCGKKINIIL
ncbi:MAG: AmmeMemoRadiSam system radical SAM enzyme [Candidatus Micrarchaeota archaeon]